MLWGLTWLSMVSRSLVARGATMTEADWLDCNDPKKMLEFLRENPSHRKLRLFACASCRRYRRKFAGEGAYRKSVELIEQYLDEKASPEEWNDARQTLISYTIDSRDSPNDNKFWQDAWEMAMGCNYFDPSFEFDWRPDISAELRMDQWNAVVRHERSHRSTLLRCIFGLLSFRSMPLDPTWLQWSDRTIPKVAQAIYDERAFGRMPLLADALEEAGCNDTDILNHCRQQGEHVRGCWVVDLILGKE